MSVRLVTNLGDILIELYVKEAPVACRNFLKLCAIKYYNWCIFHRVEKGFLAQTGDPTSSGEGGMSIEAALDPKASPSFPDEFVKALRHTGRGILGMANAGPNKNGSQFYITLADRPLPYLDDRYGIFGRVVEGVEVLKRLDNVFVDKSLRPLEDVYIKRAVILNDPFPDPKNMIKLDRSPPPTRAFIERRRPGKDDEVEGREKGKKHDPAEEEEEAQRNRARAHMRAITLELIGDRPSADLRAPENVLFICKLNPVTEMEDLKMIFSRFGDIESCEVIKDHKTSLSLGYAFIEFAKKESCEEAYRKMDNVLIDDRRIKVDFSQSLAKVKPSKPASSTALHHRDGQQHRSRHGHDQYSRRGNDRHPSQHSPDSREGRGDRERGRMPHSHSRPRSRSPNRRHYERR